MFVRPIHALLIPGNEERHHDQIGVLEHYLTESVGVPERNVRVVEYADQNKTLQQIASFFKDLPWLRPVDLVVAYA
jgi:hypothetical protein